MDATAIHDQIERILRSQSFASKAQLRKLLEILHRNIDSQENLNPELVIKELWPNEIRTKRAADVATEMNRLRHALEAYYKGEGKGDPITIVLPNRAAPMLNGTHEKLWIAAQPRKEEPEAAGLPQIKEDTRTVAQERGRAWSKVVAAAVAACAVGVVALVGLRNLIVPYQPKFGRLDGSALVIMNAEGKELWRTVFPEGFGPDWYYAQGLTTRIWFGDLEANGHTNVLFVYAPATSPMASHSSTLICYSDRGQEKWRWIPGRELPELAGSLATYKTFALGVLKATSKRPPQIVVLSAHDTWWPTQVAILDSDGPAWRWQRGDYRHRSQRV